MSRLTWKIRHFTTRVPNDRTIPIVSGHFRELKLRNMTGQQPDLTGQCPVVSGHGKLSQNGDHLENLPTKRGEEVLTFCLNLAYISSTLMSIIMFK